MSCFASSHTNQVAAIELGPDSRLGRYRILEKLGEGGMGEVYVAESTATTGRSVAIKVLDPGSASAPDFVERFRREARTMAGLAATFLEPDEGRVLVDGVDLRTVKLASYRNQLGLVLQNDFLFDGSIRENLLFARGDATDAEALRQPRARRNPSVQRAYGPGRVGLADLLELNLSLAAREEDGLVVRGPGPPPG